MMWGKMRDRGLFYIKISEKYSLRKDLNGEYIKQRRDPLEMLFRKKQQHGQKMLTDKLMNGKLEILEINPYIQISHLYMKTLYINRSTVQIMGEKVGLAIKMFLTHMFIWKAQN